MTITFPASNHHLGTALISRVDLLLILGQDALAVDLLRRRRQPVGRGPLLIRHHHAIDNLDTCESALSACVLELFEYDGVEFFVVG